MQENKKITDKDIYPAEITQVEKARNMLKIHFKGYSEIFDEWRPCNENNLPVMRLEPVSQRASSRFLHLSVEMATDVD